MLPEAQRCLTNALQRSLRHTKLCVRSCTSCPRLALHNAIRSPAPWGSGTSAAASITTTANASARADAASGQQKGQQLGQDRKHRDVSQQVLCPPERFIGVPTSDLQEAFRGSNVSPVQHVSRMFGSHPQLNLLCADV